MLLLLSSKDLSIIETRWDNKEQTEPYRIEGKAQVSSVEAKGAVVDKHCFGEEIDQHECNGLHNGDCQDDGSGR